jgi:hypothetical protein
MNPLLMSLLLIVALTVFGRTMVRKIQLLKALEPAGRTNHLKERLTEVWSFWPSVRSAWSEEQKKEVRG